MIKINRKYIIVNSLIIITLLYEIFYILYVLQSYKLIHNFSFIVHNYTLTKLMFTGILCCIFFWKILNLKFNISNKNFLFFFILDSFIVYQIIRSVINNTLGFGGLCDVLFWPLLMLIFYIESIQFNIEIQNLRKSIYFSFTVLALLSIPLIIFHLTGRGFAGAVVRPVYFSFTLLPLIMLQKKDSLQKLAIIISGVLLVASTKRAGIVAFVGSLCVYFTISMYVTGSFQKKIINAFRYIFSGSCLVLIGFFYIKISNNRIIERFISIHNDGGSHRLYMWKTILKIFDSQNIIYKFFGRGYRMVSVELTLIDHQVNAHNDFVEYLYDFGYIGVILFLLFYIILILKMMKLIRLKSEFAPVFGLCVFSLITFSSFSYGFIQSTTVNFLCIFVGYILANKSFAS